MTLEQMQDLVRECGLDWQRGYEPLFDGDPTNRYAVLIEEAIRAALAEPQEPVAWLTRDHLSGRTDITYSEATADGWKKMGYPITPFYAAPPAMKEQT